MIEGLYSARGPGVAKEIQEQLQAIQRQPEAWQIASQLLSVESDQCRFFGAHTFQVKIARDWNTFPEDRIEWLREELLSWIVRSSTGPLFITTKLCLALITYAFHTIPQQWNNFISESVQTMDNGARTLGIPANNISMAVLEFLTLVPEEVSNTEIIGGKRAQISQELKNSIPLVLSTLSSFLSTSDHIDITVQQKALNCLQSWIQYGVDFEDVYPLVRHTMMFLGNEELFQYAAEVILETMQQSSYGRYNTLRDDLLDCFSSDGMKLKLTTCITEEDDETGISLAKLLTGFGETYTEFISSQLAASNINTLLNMLMQLTDFPGNFPADQEVSEIPLNFWYMLQETLFDDGIVPIRHEQVAIVTDVDDDVAVLDHSETIPQQIAWKQQCGETAMAVYRELVTVIKRKAAFPEDSVWRSWPKDIKEKFRRCRRDLGDTMINPYYILRDELLNILLVHTTNLLDQLNNPPSSLLQDLEATMFCLKSICEEIPADENTYIREFFGPKVLGRLPTTTNDDFRLQNTILLLTGSLAEWLKVHPEFLAPIMNYIVPCLSISRLAMSAASAFSDICDICRESLTGELDSLMHVYGAMANSMIESNIMQKVVESVADVIQVLPPERAIAPLMALAGDILHGAGKALNSSTITEDSNNNDEEAARQVILAQLHNLSACCRGIQSPSDDYQSLSARNSNYDSFANGELITLYSKVDGFHQFTTAIYTSVQQIVTGWRHDEDIMKALTHFIEAGIRSINPLLTLAFDDVIALTVTSYQQTGFACWLHTATLIITVYGGYKPNYHQLRDLLGSLTEKTLDFIGSVDAMEQYPDVVHNYFNLLSRTIGRCPMTFYQLPPDMINTVFLFAIAGMGLQERLALKAALIFMAEFVAQEYDDSDQLAGTTHSLVMNMGLQIMEQLLVGIGGRVPRSFSGPLVDMLYKLTGRYIEGCRHWLNQLLAQEGFPSTLVQQSDKQAFIKGITGTRSVKKFKQCTHEFSIKCRGLNNTAFGSVA
ncbi:hypothetical protein INT45_011517 [Circinella minor]|uniref:Importin-13 n=1 Tax=Circinella minor TaxID=1195481 RepID=A0A8H7S7U3_9FUNG|nr:hypothetical protein INT45_011517 [Circinella minor]